jgi:hypothetical protein
VPPPGKEHRGRDPVNKDLVTDIGGPIITVDQATPIAILPYNVYKYTPHTRALFKRNHPAILPLLAFIESINASSERAVQMRLLRTLYSFQPTAVHINISK